MNETLRQAIDQILKLYFEGMNLKDAINSVKNKGGQDNACRRSKDK